MIYSAAFLFALPTLFLVGIALGAVFLAVRWVVTWIPRTLLDFKQRNWL